MKQSPLILLAVFCLSLAHIGHVASAATVFQTTGIGSGETWETNSIWDWASAGLTPGSYIGNDFVNPSGLNNGYRVYASDTFDGASLTINGSLVFQRPNASNGSQTYTINDLRLNGSINNFGGGGYTANVAGNMTLIGNSRIGSTNTSESRHIQVSSLVSDNGGSYELLVPGGRATSQTRFTNAGNTFDGTWRVTGGELIFANAGAVGGGNISAAGNISTLRIDGDWNFGASLTATTQATIAVATFNWEVIALTIDGNAVGNGTYTIPELNTLAASFSATPVTFTGTTGTISVVPEPTASALLAIGAGLLALRRRR